MVILDCMGQSNLALGEWKSHLPQQSGNYVTQTEDKIIYSNFWNLIFIDKEDMTPTFLSKVEGLSEVGINIVEYDPTNNQLVVVYEDSNIDLIREDGAIINIPNIKLNNSISGDKRINSIAFDALGNVYLATGFGVVSFDGATGIFSSTTITNLRVNDISYLDDRIYAATIEGLYSLDLSDGGLNLNDFSLWEIIDEAFGLSSLNEVFQVEAAENYIYVGFQQEVFRGDYKKGFAEFFAPESNDLRLSFINSSNSYLITGYQGSDFVSPVYFFLNDAIIQGVEGCVNVVLGAEVDESGRVWYADDFPIIRLSRNIQEGCEQITYNSPFHHTISDIDIKDGVVYACDGGVSDNFQYLFSRNGFYIKDGLSWTNFNEFNSSDIRNNELLSFFRIKADQFSDRLYVGSYWGGLLELDQSDNTITVYTQENSTLEGAIGDLARERITGIALDESANLWVSTYGAGRPLNVRTPEGVWSSFSVNAPSTISNITFDDLGVLWCTISGSSGGVLLYDGGDDVLTASDDRQRYINQFNSEIDAPVNEVTKDLSGEMWVATDEGPVIFDCSRDAIEEDCQGLRQIVEIDSIAAFLLADQTITAIEVDGANRKWFGTTNGIFVQSDDGEEQLFRFTEDNSPLFDNSIQDIAYEPISGEMYIATNRGMISYKTETTGGNQRNLLSDIYAYPNPVEPDYFGPVAIKGLATDAEVKITDLNGNLVGQKQALGGTAIWDLIGLDGTPVETGVYLVFSNQSRSIGSPDGVATKILVIR